MILFVRCEKSLIGLSSLSFKFGKPTEYHTVKDCSRILETMLIKDFCIMQIVINIAKHEGWNLLYKYKLDWVGPNIVTCDT